MRNREELVGDRELHVAPGICEEFGELRFLGRHPDDVRREIAEQLLRAIAGRIVVRTHYLRQAGQLLQRVPLGDPLRTECDLNVARSGLEGAGYVFARSGVDRASEDDRSEEHTSELQSRRY